MAESALIENVIIGVVSPGHSYVLYDPTVEQWITEPCGQDAEDAGFVGLPDTPGVYRCTAKLIISRSWSSLEEDDMELKVITAETILLFPPPQDAPGEGEESDH